MSTHTIRLDDGVKEETTRIADALGLNFNLVVNTLLRKFNAAKGFPFPVRLGSEETVLICLWTNSRQPAGKLLRPGTTPPEWNIRPS